MSPLSNSFKKTVQYTLRDIKNATSRAVYKEAILNPAQQSLLNELKQNGFAMISVEQAFSSGEWNSYCESVDAFLQDPGTINNRKKYYEGSAAKEFKEGSFNKTFILRGTDIDKDFLKKTPLSSFKNNDFLKPVINNYYGQPSKIIYCDYWYTLKTHNAAEDIYSQSWHCDPEGDKIVKIFVYFTDVDERSGALQYIKGSQQGGKNAGALKGIRRHKNFYPDKAFIEANFSKEDIIYAKAPKGSIIICDTRGLHRGGKCLDHERVMGVLEYLDSGSFAYEVV